MSHDSTTFAGFTCFCPCIASAALAVARAGVVAKNGDALFQAYLAHPHPGARSAPRASRHTVCAKREPCPLLRKYLTPCKAKGFVATQWAKLKHQRQIAPASAAIAAASLPKPHRHTLANISAAATRRNCCDPADACSSRNPVQACGAASSAGNAAGNGFPAQSAIKTHVHPSLQTKARLEGKSSR